MAVPTGARKAELPPRTRRIQTAGTKRFFDDGTTSAYAENTVSLCKRSSELRNYLRVRGEYLMCESPMANPMELPPRTRRIRAHKRTANSPQGTTSAYAENTIANIIRSSENRNYLRVRGEYNDSPSSCSRCMELPPRTRRIPPCGDD